MEILTHHDYQRLLDYIPHIKTALPEWQIVDIRVTSAADDDFTTDQVARMVQSLFPSYEGKIYICNQYELFMLIRWDKDSGQLELAKKIEIHLPPGSCQVMICSPTPEGLKVLEILIQHQNTGIFTFANKRASRRKNVVLVADDDMYMRSLVKQGLAPLATIHEVMDGDDVIKAYHSYAPDIVFLDIHMPGRNGIDVLHDILSVDPDAYVIMLSADSSVKNVGRTVRKDGAKGFMAKPFTKNTLLEFAAACPTFQMTSIDRFLEDML